MSFQEVRIVMQFPIVQAADRPLPDEQAHVKQSSARKDEERDEVQESETARNGSSFLALIQKISAGSMDGKGDTREVSLQETAGRGAGGAQAPGEENTLNKSGADGELLTVGNTKGKETVLTAKGATLHEKSERLDKMQGKNQRPIPPGGGRVEKEVAKSLEEMNVESLVSEENEVSFDIAGKNTKGDNVPLAPEHLLVASGQAVQQKAHLQQDGESPSERPSITRKDSRQLRRDERSVFSLRDERTLEALRPESASALETRLAESADGGTEMSISLREGIGEGQRGSSFSGQSLFSGGMDGGKGEAPTFSQMLSQELKTSAGEFVKAGQIVLKDGNAGVIRLTLNPASLGNVRINLELSSDRKVSGRIMVSSQDAFDAFNESLEELSIAFKEGGFDSADFDLSWSGSGNGKNAQDTAMAAKITPFYASSIPDVMSDAKSSDTKEGARGYMPHGAIDVYA